MLPLPSVPIAPQTQAGGQFPETDCLPELAASLSAYYAARKIPGVAARTVRECEQWLAANHDPVNDGTRLDTGARCLREYCGIPCNPPAQQPIDMAAGRNHYAIDLVRALLSGIPTATGSTGHYVLGLGQGHFGNPADGSDDTYSAYLGTAYQIEGGWCIEILLPARVAAPAPAPTIPGVRDMELLNHRGHIYCEFAGKVEPVPPDVYATLKTKVRETPLTDAEAEFLAKVSGVPFK